MAQNTTELRDNYGRHFHRWLIEMEPHTREQSLAWIQRLVEYYPHETARTDPVSMIQTCKDLALGVPGRQSFLPKMQWAQIIRNIALYKRLQVCDNFFENTLFPCELSLQEGQREVWHSHMAIPSPDILIA